MNILVKPLKIISMSRESLKKKKGKRKHTNYYELDHMYEKKKKKKKIEKMPNDQRRQISVRIERLSGFLSVSCKYTDNFYPWWQTIKRCK